MLRRWPFVLPFAVLACIAARIHVHVGSTEANLLVPMYAVVAAAALLLAWELLQGDTRARELGPVAWPLAAFVAWSGLSILWTQDLRQGAIDLLFFYLPFGLLAIVLARLAWSRLIAIGLLVELTAMALVFSAIGIYQYETRDVFWNPKLLVSNAFAPFYRVNSVFWDPSIYGRFLVVAILALLVVVLFTRDRRVLLGATAAIAVIWAGLYFSYSQSSFAALAAGVVLAAVFAWGRRGLVARDRRGVVVAAAALAAPSVRHDVFGHNTKSTTSGRGTLVRRGAHIAVHHPVAGVGIGGFKHAYAELAGPEGQGAGRGRLAHDAGDGRRRGRDRRLRALRLAARGRASSRVPPLRARPAGPRGAHVRPRDRRGRRPQPLLQRVLRGPDRLGRDRPRRRLPRRPEEPAEPPPLDREVEPERQQDERVDGAQQQGAAERDVEALPEHR